MIQERDIQLTTAAGRADAKINPRGQWRQLFGFGGRRQQRPVASQRPIDEKSVPGSPLGKVLVIDDDTIILKTIAMKLEPQGYAVAKKEHVAEALTTIRTEKPDIILLDVHFPVDGFAGTSEWDGFSMMGWLRRLEKTRNIPIIMISGTDTKTYRERTKAAGALDFFPKPIDHERLLSVIKRSLHSEPPSEQAAECLGFEI
jgi:CheY-like chemotaxis protein